MLPEWMSAGSRMEGNSIYACICWLWSSQQALEEDGIFTRRLSSVRSTATPASTLPTVSETSMVLILGVVDVVVRVEDLQADSWRYCKLQKRVKRQIISETSSSRQPAPQVYTLLHLDREPIFSWQSNALFTPVRRRLKMVLLTRPSPVQLWSHQMSSGHQQNLHHTSRI